MNSDVPGTARETTVEQLSKLDYGWVIRLPKPRIEPLPDDDRYRVRPVRPVVRAFGGELVEVKVVRTFKGNMPVDKYVLTVLWLGKNWLGRREMHLSEHLVKGSSVSVLRKYVEKPSAEDSDNPFVPGRKRKAPAAGRRKRPNNLVWSSDDLDRKS